MLHSCPKLTLPCKKLRCARSEPFIPPGMVISVYKRSISPRCSSHNPMASMALLASNTRYPAFRRNVLKRLRSSSSASTSKIISPPYCRGPEDAGHRSSLWDNASPSRFAPSCSGMGVRFDSRSSGCGFKWSILKNLHCSLLGYASTTGSKASLTALIP